MVQESTTREYIDKYKEIEYFDPWTTVENNPQTPGCLKRLMNAFTSSQTTWRTEEHHTNATCVSRGMSKPT